MGQSPTKRSVRRSVSSPRMCMGSRASAIASFWSSRSLELLSLPRKTSKKYGSALKFGMIAAGEADLYPQLRPEDGVGYSRWASHPRSGEGSGRNPRRGPARLRQARPQERRLSRLGCRPSTLGGSAKRTTLRQGTPPRVSSAIGGSLNWKRAFPLKQENSRAELVAQHAPNGQSSYVEPRRGIVTALRL
jgi:hypothetical protein